jgi:hypothetical protein
MLSDLQLREQLAKFLAGNLSRDEFEDWFVQSSWNMHEKADFETQRLVSAIELLLAENSSGHLLDKDLYEELRSLASIRIVRMPTTQNVVISTGANPGTFINQPLGSVNVDMRPSKASV